jgi:hypothetical protein
VIVWTAADAAELDVLLYVFVETVWIHQARCGICSKGGPWCQPLKDCFEELLAWRKRRELLSVAARLRAKQDFADLQPEGGRRAA